MILAKREGGSEPVLIIAGVISAMVISALVLWLVTDELFVGAGVWLGVGSAAWRDLLL